MTRDRVITVMLVVLLLLTAIVQLVTITMPAPMAIVIIGTVVLISEGALLYLHLRYHSPIVPPALCVLIILATIVGETPGYMQKEVLITVFVPSAIAAVLFTPRWVLITFVVTLLGLALNTWIKGGRWEWAALGPTYTAPNLAVGLFLVGSISVASWVRHQALSELEATNKDLEQQVAERTQALATALRAAEAANEMKSKFLANMSHELRTPLNSIINFTKLVLTRSRLGSLTDQQRERLERVLANGEHLLDLINDILDLAKIEAGQLDLRFQPFNILPLLRSGMSTAIGLTKGKPIELDLVLDLPSATDLPLVHIDPTRIRQVVLNLLSNAAKFTERGSITMRVRLTDEGFVEVAVQDTGIGIAPEHQALVFEEFRQVDGELNRSQQGTGLGLAITKRLVELHGGSLSLESTPGVGSTFTFTLPVAQVMHALDSAQAPCAESESSALAGPPLVIVVDDDPDAHRIVKDMLGEENYRIHAILDSRQALATIEHMRPQLIILDVQMPGLDGWQVLEQVRTTRVTATIPVLMYTIVEQRRLGIALGATEYLVKPVSSDLLLTTVQRCITTPATVLIIDDDPDARSIIRTTLADDHYKLIEAPNGPAGLDIVHTQRVDLIILDLMMPGMDGFEFLEQLGGDLHAGRPAVIVVTAKDLLVSERQWLHDRALLCIQKSQLAPEKFQALVRSKIVESCSLV